MNFTVTEDQALMVSSAKRMVDTRIEPVLRRHCPDQPLPKTAMLEIFSEFAKLWITAPRLPAEAGGGGLRMLDYGLILEQLFQRRTFARVA